VFRPVATPSIREVLSEDENDNSVFSRIGEVEMPEEQALPTRNVTIVVDQLGEEVNDWLRPIIPTRIEVEEEK